MRERCGNLREKESESENFSRCFYRIKITYLIKKRLKFSEAMKQGGLKNLPIDQMLPIAKKYASEGDPNGQILLGFMHEQGVGVPQDRSLAIACYQNAAIQGDPTALILLRRLGVKLNDRNQ
jgi:TPR repeat protein